jgi:hypothetical protein
MIRISASCETCGATWAPKKDNGPERNRKAAQRWADAHGRWHQGHTVRFMSADLFTTPRGSRVSMLDLEITRR